MFDSSDPRLAELLELYGDDALDADGLEELNEILRGSATARRAFVAHCIHSQMLREVFAPKPPSQIENTKPTPVKSRSQPIWADWRVSLAAAVCLLIAVGIWTSWRTATRPVNPVPPNELNVQLVSNWHVTPAGNAEYRVLEPARIRLERGELLVASTNPEAEPGEQSPPLRIETPYGEAFAAGTRFYIGTHSPQEREEQVMLKPLTRVLILSGVVTLTTAMGTVEGTSGDLLAAEPDQAPTKLTVQANSDFAFDLYQQLAKENEGKNMFFSPYSVSNALAMAAEGARGITAQEMGNVLRFPKEVRRIGNDGQFIPWETSLIHTGLAELNSRLDGGNSDPEKVAQIRSQLEALRKERDEAEIQAESAWKNHERSKDKADRKIFVTEAKKVGRLRKQIRDLASQIDHYKLSVANALWVERSHGIRDQFVDTINRHYQTGGAFTADFRGNYESERMRINQWVTEQTDGKIGGTLPEGSLDQLTKLVLINAIYFKGNWSTPFKEDRTKNQPFTLANGKRVEKKMMHGSDFHDRYAAFDRNGKIQMLELPYVGGDLSMLFILPEEGGLPALEAQLNAETLNQWIDRMEHRDVHVVLPKFKLETEYSLGDESTPGTLQRMGMKHAFANPQWPDGADFGGICESGDDPLYISSIFHMALLEVNEKSTEAIAVTALPAPSDSVGGGPITPWFVADRPFVFAIREKTTGSILFLGRIMEPND